MLACFLLHLSPQRVCKPSAFSALAPTPSLRRCTPTGRHHLRPPFPRWSPSRWEQESSRSPCSHASGNLEQCPIPRPPWTPHFLNTRRLDSQHRSLSPRGTSQLHVALSWRRCSAAGYRQLLRQPDYALFRLILAHSRRQHESSMHLNLLICSKGPVMVASHTTAHTDSYQLSLPMPIPILVQN